MKFDLSSRQINQLAFLCVFILLFFGFLFYQQTHRLMAATNLVFHSHNVIEVADNILKDFNLAVSRQRGYLLTNDQQYRELYQETTQHIYEELAALQYLTRDNVSQQILVHELRLSVDEQIYLLNKIQKSFEEKGINQTLELLAKDPGLSGLSKVRNLGDEVINAEKILLLKRNIQANRDSNFIIMVISIGYLTCVIIIFMWFLFLNKQLKLRAETEKKLKISKEHLLQLAYYDNLTGLPNRILLLEKMNEVIANAKENNNCIIICYIDLDNFKNINDSFGYNMGDELLILVAKRLKDLESAHKFIAHIGSDEFVIMATTDCEKDNVETFSKNILSLLSAPIILQDQQIFITASLGLSFYPLHGNEAKTLLKNANIAMYRAKDAGKNTYQTCTQEMSLEAEERALLGYYLYQAVIHEEFVMLYQPKISLQTGVTESAEALIRWRRPNGALIYPTHFISLAESNGLIVDIGEWMMRTVCEQIKTWQRKKLHFKTIAINISPYQINSSDFIASFEKVLAETKIDPTLIELEITETILVKNSAHNIATLQMLKRMGANITIDDFGTGFSSLSYLRLFTIDKLKIDKFFVKEITEENQESAIIRAIIVMAHSLGIKVVAEGVETAIQANLLKKYQCDEVQGFYYAKPLSTDEIETFLKVEHN